MHSTANGCEEILRFRRAERHLHWSIAIPFMVSYATAAILVGIYNPSPARPFREVFSWAHRLSGICLIILPLLTVLAHRHDFRIHVQNVRHAWSWGFRDLKWLVLMGPAALSSRISLPDQGKFNAAEKINFMVLMATYPLYIITGVLIWLPGVALLSWLIHFCMAVIATPLMLGHIFMATINPDTRVGLRGMITGFVAREWAKHHYRLWYQENFERGGEVAESVPAVTAGKPVVPVLVAKPIVPIPAATPAVPMTAKPLGPVPVAKPLAPVQAAKPLAPVQAAMPVVSVMAPKRVVPVTLASATPRSAANPRGTRAGRLEEQEAACDRVGAAAFGASV